MNMITLCAFGYGLVVLVFWLGLCRVTGRAQRWMEAMMKACEMCGKPPKGMLATKLLMGPKGYRQYQACPECREKADKKAATKATANGQRASVGD